MGTRALIRVNDTTNECNVMVYKHWDGYPSAMLPWLFDRMNDFLKYRSPTDYGYFVAYLLKTILSMPENFRIDKSIHTGYGVFTDTKKGKNKTKLGDYGSDYIYTIDLEKGTISIISDHGTKIVDSNITDEELSNL